MIQTNTVQSTQEFNLAVIQKELEDARLRAENRKTAKELALITKERLP